jgi:hypothetical protein
VLKWFTSKIATPTANAAPADGADPARRVRALVERGALEEAHAALRDALEARPSADLLRMLGALHAGEQRYDDAADALYQALQLEPRHAAAANLLGVCLSLAMRLDEAAAYYGLALECDPSLADAYANAGWNSLLVGGPEANRFFREWLARMRGPQGFAAAPAADRLRLEAVTLCCVDCAYHSLAADALRLTLAKCDFEEALFLSDRDCGVNGVRFVKVDPITSAAQYSNFVFHKLREYIATDHVLIVQYDGFVLNAAAWDPSFLRYDYVGAPMRTNDGYVVGNGGFSLRSRKLLDALRNDPETSRYDALRGPLHEDIAICKVYRSALETRHGIAFAPVAVADRFAAESSSPTASNFGFHNILHLVGLYQNQFRLPETAEKGTIDIAFRAQTEFGALTVPRQIEIHSKPGFWAN